ncbi:hypothetical protein PRIPAC_82205 [Pristionchus pacificus]|uniref:G protein-coupled receptor n=1 Tax=Pristionchus pacificus TaxID=54126 RepID=A0A2A6CNT9_PRIPA|nr:hypothetical protein PRIPAC_82205 [Pristionchus pacificus]|eukprot:PDM79691.1 G protein-coupled receptor [Pristionchus pacificus]
MFGSVVSECFYHTFSAITTSVSCISNLLLIYVVAVTRLAHVGPYRYLLLIFAVVDVLISLVHFALIPAIHMTAFGYIYFGYRFVHEDTALGNWASLIWVALFYQTFVLLAYHYVYRYVMMCNPRWLSAFRQNPWRNWLTVTVLADVGFISGIILACFIGLLPYDFSRKKFAPILKEVYNVDLLAPNKPGYLGIVYWVCNSFDPAVVTLVKTQIINEKGEKEWLMHSLVAIGLVILLFFSTAAIITWCIVRIVREMSKGKLYVSFIHVRFHALKSKFSASMAPATKRLQKQLFRTLLWQVIFSDGSRARNHIFISRSIECTKNEERSRANNVHIWASVSDWYPVPYHLHSCRAAIPCSAHRQNFFFKDFHGSSSDLGISLEGIGTVLMMSTALFPMLDPYIVIFLISGCVFFPSFLNLSLKFLGNSSSIVFQISKSARANASKYSCADIACDQQQ